MNFLLLMLLLFSVFLFYYLTHPMALGVNLLIQTIFISILIGLNSHSFWMSYVLFLVFMGGILVLVMYIVSLANNEILLFNISSFMKIVLIFMSLMMFILMMMNFLEFNFFSQSKSFFYQYTDLMKSSLMNLYNYPNFIMILFLALYLFYMLTIISHIIKISEGPLRSN